MACTSDVVGMVTSGVLSGALPARFGADELPVRRLNTRFDFWGIILIIQVQLPALSLSDASSELAATLRVVLADWYW